MKIVRNSIGFYILFPSFLIYQALVQFGYIPPIFGGYFTLGAVICLPFAVYAFLFLRSKTLLLGSRVVIGYLLFLFLLALVTFVGHINLANPETVSVNGANLLRSIAIFLVILCFDSAQRENGTLIKFFFVFYSLLVLAFSFDGSFVVRGLEIDGSIFQVDYQTTAVVYILFLIYIIPAVDFKMRALLYALAMPSLFYIGARSELIAFIPLIFVMELLLTRSSVVYWVKMALFGGAVLVAGFVFYAEYSDSRIFNLLNMGSDASGAARSDFSVRAMQTIAENPILGKFASYPPGEYAHNILSIWVDFGLLGFLFFLALLAMQGMFLLRRYRAGDVSRSFFRAASAYSMTVVMLATAKNYGYPMIPMAIAFYAIFWREMVLDKRRAEIAREIN